MREPWIYSIYASRGPIQAIPCLLAWCLTLAGLRSIITSLYVRTGRRNGLPSILASCIRLSGYASSCSFLVKSGNSHPSCSGPICQVGNAMWAKPNTRTTSCHAVSTPKSSSGSLDSRLSNMYCPPGLPLNSPLAPLLILPSHQHATASIRYLI